MDALQPGTQLGGYAIDSQIGRGAMSVVYRARRAGSSRWVAIKVLLSSLATQDGFVERFKREARAVSMLAHRNIVSLYEYGEQGGHVYLVMEYVPGISLGQLLRARIPVARSVGYAMQLADALRYAHDLGVIHRDIKPGNLMIEDETDRVVLMDFGFSKIAEESLQLTRPGTNLGTPHFMSPEQILGRPVDGRTDIYAAGIVLYQLVTGKLPYTAENGNPVAVLKRVLQDPMPSPRLEAPSLPPSLEHVILTATAKNKEDRFPDAWAFREALAACLADLPSVASRPLPLASRDDAEPPVTADHAAEMEPMLARALSVAPGTARARASASTTLPTRVPMSAGARMLGTTSSVATSSRSLLSARPSTLSRPPTAIPEGLADAALAVPGSKGGLSVSPNLVALLVVAAIIALAFVVIVIGHHA